MTGTPLKSASVMLSGPFGHHLGFLRTNAVTSHGVCGMSVKADLGMLLVLWLPDVV